MHGLKAIGVYECVCGVLCAEGVKTITELMGLAVCERSEKVPEGKQTHVLCLSGAYRGGHEVLVQARFASLASGSAGSVGSAGTGHAGAGATGVNMHIEVRATDESTAAIFVASVS